MPPLELPVFDGYTTLGELGSGGFGAVYLARGPEGRVAIKLAHRGREGAEARLRREAVVLRTIGPPHVPRLHATGQLQGGGFYVVMELITWPTLAERLGDRPGWSPTEVLPVARGICTAVDAAHAHGLVHRDLKPENIFVADDGTARLVDFGLTRLAARSTDTGITATGAVLGSYAYMSPEQAMGRGELDVRSDVYALGVILYEMLAGRPPFHGLGVDVLHAHMVRRPPRLSSLVAVPAALEALVHRCLAKAPEDRPAGVAALRAALEAVSLEAEAPSPLAPAAASLARPVRQARAAGLLTFAAGAAAIHVSRVVGALGGQVVRFTGAFAVVFDAVGENPARRALLGARTLVEQGLAGTVIVDVAQVTVVTRADGARRYLSPAFEREASYPRATDPPGVLCAPAAAEALGGLPGEPLAMGLWAVDTAATLEAPTGGVAGALVGRGAELTAIVAAALQARGGTPALITVLGDAGAGKSRLLGAARERLALELPDAEIVELVAREPVGVHVGAALRDLLRLALELPDERPDDGGRALVAERLGFLTADEVWPGVAVALDWASPDDPLVRAQAAAPSALRAAAARAAATALRLRAAETPLCIFVDDAHHADNATLEALELATLDGTGARLCACVAARPALVAGVPAWGDRAGVARRVTLGPLADADAATLLRRLLRPAEHIPDAAVARLLARTDGVPLLLSELARGLKRDGLVRRHAKGDGWYLAVDALQALPDLPLIEWLAAGELAALSAELALHARLHALLGAAPTLDEVAAVLVELDRAGLGAELPLDATVAAARLRASGLLGAGADGGTRFRSEVLREAIVRATPPELARPIHEAACRVHAGDPRALAAFAYHAGRCGRRAESFTTYLVLAERAQARHAYLDAEGFYGGALAQQDGEPPANVARALRGRGLMRTRLSRYDDALVDLGAARERVRGDVAAELDLLLDEATVRDWLQQYAQSRDQVEEARALAAALPEGPGPLAEARLVLGRGRSATRFFELELAAERLLEAERRAVPLGDAGYETGVIALLLAGYVLSSLGRLDEAEAAFERVIPQILARGDKTHLGVAYANRFILWVERRRPERIADDLRDALAIARETGNPRLELLAHLGSAECMHWLGHDVEAEAHIRRAIETDDRRMGAFGHVESRVLLGRILALRGDVAGARATLDEIRARQQAARAQASHDVFEGPWEKVMLTYLDLLTREATPGEWAVLAELARGHLSGREQGEVLQQADRHGDLHVSGRGK